MKITKGLIIASLVIALAGLGAVGCNTFRGAGKDIQQGGRAVENAAENAQDGRGHRAGRHLAITASSDSGGSISPSGNILVPYGADRTFTVAAKNGYRVANVLIDGKPIGVQNRYTFSDVKTNHTISASFSPNP